MTTQVMLKINQMTGNSFLDTKENIQKKVSDQQPYGGL